MVVEGGAEAGWAVGNEAVRRGHTHELESELAPSQLASDRTSCRSRLANQMRLILPTAAHWLMRTLRDAIPRPQPLANGEFSTIRVRLLKIAVQIKETASWVSPAFAANRPNAALFRGLIGTFILRPT